MRALLRTVAALLSTRTPITPHLCLRCEKWVTSISRKQQRAAVRDGHITCRCGEQLRDVDQAVGL